LSPPHPPPAMASERPRLVVVGGDGVIGGALEIMLQAAGCSVRFILSPDVDRLGELVGDYQMLLVAPGLSYEYRKALLDVMAGSAALAKVPILELVSADGERALQSKWAVPWPCPVEKLKRAIDVALLSGR
jgi:hypothetical protein